MPLLESQGLRFKGLNDSGEEGSRDKPATISSTPRGPRALEARRLQRLLRENLAAFLGRNAGGLHTLKKLHAADVKRLFVGCASGTSAPKTPTDSNPASRVVRSHPQKGGYQVSAYLTVDW